VKLAAVGLLAMALIYGAYQAIGATTGDPPTNHVIVVDGSKSFATEVQECPGQLAPIVRDATSELGRLSIASFARGALGRPWSYDVDYRAEYDRDHDRGKVEFKTRDDWFDDRAAAAEAELDETVARSPEFGSVLLEQLERIALEMEDRGDRRLKIVICSDGEIVDEHVDIREDFDQQKAIDVWIPRLSGLEGATVRVIGFGKGLKPEENRRSREFLTTLLDMAGVSTVEIEPGSER